MNETFLIVALFIPRISLLYCYGNGLMPFNTVPYWADVVMAFFVPRILIIIYMVQNDYYGTWFWVHLIVAILVYLESCNGTKES